jgi:hypothetical protein
MRTIDHSKVVVLGGLEHARIGDVQSSPQADILSGCIDVRLVPEADFGARD